MKRYDFQMRGASTAELMIYGDIGADPWADESNDAKTVVKAISQAKAPSLEVRINSAGGSVADALAIYNAIKNFSGQTTVHIEGIAFSAASYIAMAGQVVKMAENALLMIHAPWTVTAGDARDLREMADTLDRWAGAMASGYARSGRIDAELARSWLMDGHDHYFDAAQALDIGLADQLTEAIPLAASLRDAFTPFTVPAAAASAATRSMEAEMANDTMTPPAAPVESAGNDTLAAHNKTVQAAMAQGIKAEATRRGKVAAVFSGFYDADPLNPITALYEECMSDTKCGELDAQRKVLSLLADRTSNPVVMPEAQVAPPQATGLQMAAKRYIQPGRDAGDALVQGLTEAMMVKAGVETDKEKIRSANRNEFLSYDFADIAREMLRAQGIAPPMGKHQLFQKAIRASGIGQTSSNFADILENIATKAALQGFEDAEETWQQWCQIGTLPDFKAASRVNLSLFGALDELQEGQQYEHGSFSDIKEGIQAINHGKLYSISLEALTNDDLGVLSRIPAAMGGAANRTVGNSAYAILTTGATTYTMDQDSVLLFNAATHKNYVTSGGAPAVATVSAGRTAMATQTDPSGATIGIRARYLLHPEALWATVYALLGSTEITTSNVGTVNAIRAMNLIPISDHRLDTFNAAGWFLAAASNTVEVAFVGGQRTPQLERQQTWDADGVAWKVRLPFGVAATDYRGLYYNDGA